MKVAYIFFSSEGGDFHYPLELGKGLTSQVEVSVFHPYDEISSEFPESATFTYNVSDNDDVSIFVKLTILFRMLYDIYVYNPDIVHFPFFAGKPVKILIPLVAIHPSKKVITIHDPISHSRSRQPCLDIKSFTRRLFSILADKIIVLGPNSLTQAKSAGYSERKLEVVPHGLNNHFKTSRNTHIDTDIKPENKTILFFGHVRYNKGTDRIPKIASKVNDKLSNTEFIVAGSVVENESADWKESVKHALNTCDSVKFLNGYVPDKKVKSLFDNSDLCILPYRDATASGVLLTAYAFDTPVVATEVGDLGWMVNQDNTGIVIKEYSSHRMAHEIINMLEQNKIGEYEQNIISVKQEYAWRNVAEETVSIYENALDE